MLFRSNRISWPVSYAGWILETNASINTNAAVWSAVSISKFQTNGATVIATVPLAGANVFYRLRKP